MKSINLTVGAGPDMPKTKGRGGNKELAFDRKADFFRGYGQIRRWVEVFRTGLFPFSISSGENSCGISVRIHAAAGW